MSTTAIDTYRLLRSLKATGKSENFTADEIAQAIDVAQEDSQLVTRRVFDDRMDAFAGRMGSFDSRMDAFEATMHVKLDALRADIKAEVKSSRMQNLLWLSGIILASNGAVIAVLARAARLY